MTHKIETSLASRTQYENGINVTMYKPAGIAFGLGAKLAGAAMMYYIGRRGGKVLDTLPYIRNALPQFVRHISGVNVENRLDDFGGLFGAIYGFGTSGLDFDATLKLKGVRMPFLYIKSPEKDDGV